MDTADFDNLICHFFRRTAPDEIAQLLQIPRMAFHDVAQLFCLLFADFFVRPVEGIDDEGHPFLFLYLVQEQYLSEAVEGVRRIVEDIHHHMPLASVKAIGDLLLLLPGRAHFSLHTFVAG